MTKEITPEPFNEGTPFKFMKSEKQIAPEQPNSMENDKPQHTQSWTPEPWEYQVQKENICVVFTNNKKIITGRISSDDCGHPQCCKIEEHANAQRIVSCVNALAGIDNPAEFVAQSKAKDGRIRELKEQIEQRWISVEERLPKSEIHDMSERVLTINKRNEIHFAYYDYEGERWTTYLTDDPIAWQPLPALPTNKKEEEK